MINFKFSKIFLLSLIIIVLSSCSYIFTDHQYDYLKEEIRKPLEIPDSSKSKAIIDKTVEDREKEKAREEEIPGPDEESIKEVKDGEKKDSTQTDDNQNNQGTPPSEEEGQEKDKQE